MENPWTWQKGCNPYKHNAFMITGIDVDVVQRGAIVKKLDALLRRLKYKPDQIVVNGKRITESDINHVRNILVLNANRRMIEELLCHRTHKLDKSVLNEAVDQLRRLQPRCNQERQLHVADTSCLKDLLPITDMIPGKPFEFEFFPKEAMNLDEITEKSMIFDQ